MTKMQRKKIARAALDALGIAYPKSGKGSGVAKLEEMVSDAKGIGDLLGALATTVKKAATVLEGLDDDENWDHDWYVADHAENGTLMGHRSVVHYGPKPPKHAPPGGGRWKKRKKPPKWLGNAAKFAATVILKAIL